MTGGMDTGHSISVVSMIYHRAGTHAQPTAIDIRFSRALVTDEQAWGPRQIKVTEKWQPLDCGWLKPEMCGMLVLENLEGKHLQVVPTDEQRAETAAKVVEIGLITNIKGICQLAWDLQSQQFGGGTAIGNEIQDKFKDKLVTPLLEIRPKESQSITPVDISSLRIRCRKGEAKCTLTVLPR